MSEMTELATALEQRDRARETLDKIRGIVVALSKLVGTNRTAIRAIAGILHVSLETPSRTVLSDLGERLKRLAIRYADARVNAEVAYERQSVRQNKHELEERRAWSALLAALVDVKDPDGAP